MMVKNKVMIFGIICINFLFLNLIILSFNSAHPSSNNLYFKTSKLSEDKKFNNKLENQNLRDPIRLNSKIKNYLNNDHSDNLTQQIDSYEPEKTYKNDEFFSLDLYNSLINTSQIIAIANLSIPYLYKSLWKNSQVRIYNNTYIEMLIKFTNNSFQIIHSFLETNSLNYIKSLYIPFTYLVLASQKNLNKIYLECVSSSLVVYLEPNSYEKGSYIPNDNQYDQQWNIPSVQLDLAWNFTMGSHSTKIAIIDSGVNYNHEDLIGNYLNIGYDWVNNDPSPMDDHGHGTDVTGVISATINNLKGISGASNVAYFAEKVLDANNLGSISDVASGINHAILQGADILLLSWGTYTYSTFLFDSIQAAIDVGITVVSAIGNDGIETRMYPAAFEGVICVGGSTPSDQRASFSNYGEWLDVLAPAENILTTTKEGIYSYESGTSLAAPLVAGIISLLIDTKPTLSNTEILSIITSTCTDLGTIGFDKYHGYGKVNAYTAIRSIIGHNVGGVINLPSKIPNDVNSTIQAKIHNTGFFDEFSVKYYLYINDTLVINDRIVSLPVDANVQINHSFLPPQTGTYNITLQIYPVNNESVLADNTFTFYSSTIEKQLYVNIGDVITYNSSENSNFFSLKWEITQILSPIEYCVTLSTYSISQNKEIILANYTMNSYTSSFSGLWEIFPYWKNQTSFTVSQTVDIYQNGDSYGLVVDTTNISYFGDQIEVYMVNGKHSETFYYEMTTGILVRLNITTIPIISLFMTNKLNSVYTQHNLNIYSNRPLAKYDQDNLLIVLINNNGFYNETSYLTIYENNTELLNISISVNTGRFTTYQYIWRPLNIGITNLSLQIKFVNGETIFNDNIINFLINVTSLLNYNTYYYPFNWLNVKDLGSFYNFSTQNPTEYIIHPLEFNFSYYGIPFEELYISRNGKIYMTEEGLQSSNVNNSFPNLKNKFEISVFPVDTQSIFELYISNNSQEFVIIEFHNVREKDTNNPIGTYEVILCKNQTIIIQFLDTSNINLYPIGLNYGYNLSYYTVFNNEYNLASNYSIIFTYDNFILDDVKVNIKTPAISGMNTLVYFNATFFNTGTTNLTNIEYNVLVNSKKLYNENQLINLTYEQTITKQLPWVPQETGFYNITLYVYPKDNEFLLINNKEETEITILGLNITNLNSNTSTSDARISIQYIRFLDYNLKEIKIIINSVYTLTITPNINDEIFIPIFNNGTNTISMEGKWYYLNITSINYFNITGNNLTPLITLQKGDYIEYNVTRLENNSIQRMILNVEGVINLYNVNMSLKIQRINQTNNWITKFFQMNIYNGYILSQNNLFDIFSSSNFFLFQKNKVNISEKLFYETWNDIYSYSNYVIWNDYNLIEFNNIISTLKNISLILHNQTGVILRLIDITKNIELNYVKSTFIPLPDLEKPIISSPKDRTILEHTKEQTIDWEGEDKFPNTYTVEINGMFILTDFWDNNKLIKINISTKEVGIHNYTIILFDKYNNSNYDSAIINIKNVLDSPVVKLLSPNGGENITREFLIQWEANDLDQDHLVFTIQVWNGNTWSTIVTNYDGSQYLWNVKAYKSGIHYKIRIVVTDGVLIGIDESDSYFSIINKQNVELLLIFTLVTLIIPIIVVLSKKTDSLRRIY